MVEIVRVLNDPATREEDMLPAMEALVDWAIQYNIIKKVDGEVMWVDLPVLTDRAKIYSRMLYEKCKKERGR